jgi:hypothetical protein
MRREESMQRILVENFYIMKIEFRKKQWKDWEQEEQLEIMQKV